MCLRHIRETRSRKKGIILCEEKGKLMTKGRRKVFYEMNTFSGRFFFFFSFSVPSTCKFSKFLKNVKKPGKRFNEITRK